MADESAGTRTHPRLAMVTSMVQVLSVVAGVAISVAAFFAAQAKESDTRKAEAETRRLELQKLEREERDKEREQRDKTEQAARETLRPFLQLRQERYMEAVRSAGVLVSPQAHTPDELKQAHKRFFELYWGELSLVEDTNVSAAMVALGRLIDAKAMAGTEAQRASLALAHALRDSLVRSWHVDDVVK
jgi:hypothetical protein